MYKRQGKDRPGIVAAVTGVLLRHGVNIEDGEMAILRGHFTLVLVVGVPDDADADALRRDLGDVRDELPLESLSLSEVDTLTARTPSATHAMSIYGADHPGIVHGITRALADVGVNVIGLTTRVVGDDGLYVMLLEAAVPQDRTDEIEDLLADVAAELGVDVSVREIDVDVL